MELFISIIDSLGLFVIIANMEIFKEVFALLPGIIGLFTVLVFLFRFVKQLRFQRMIKKNLKEMLKTPFRTEYSISQNSIKGLRAIRKTVFHAVTGEKLCEIDCQRIGGVLFAQSV